MNAGDGLWLGTFPGTRGRRGEFVGLLIAFKVGLLFWLAWNRRIVMDEFQQLGWAKYIPGQISQLAVQHPKAEGYAVFFKLAHLIGWNARSILLAGRMQMALLALGTLAIVYALARSLGEPKVKAALIVLILLSFSNFMERIFETRGDPLSVFFAASALLVAVRGHVRGWPVLVAGVLSGLAFLSTQKAVYFNFALGVALVADAALDRRIVEGVARGAWLLIGWAVPIVVYCLVLGGRDPLAVAHNLLVGPVGAASPQIASEYGGLRQFVVQTVARNALLYLFCACGIVVALLRLPRMTGAQRVALIFSVIITTLVFAHNQPWPYVFIMALPFMSLWATWPLEALADNRLLFPAAWAVLSVAIAGSFVRNIHYLHIDNHAQLALVGRAEKLIAPRDIYFDGIGMLPNRREPSTLWLDRHSILHTMRQGNRSEAYRIFTQSPPKVILWSYRMDAIEPLIGPLIRYSYVQVAPNIRLAGVLLQRGLPARFDVPVGGSYALYRSDGQPLRAELVIDDVPVQLPVMLRRRSLTATLQNGPVTALLVPKADHSGEFANGADKDLFADVYK